MIIEKKKWYMMLLAAACFLPSEVMAAPAADPWVYDDLQELASAGFLQLPAKDLHTLSRDELAALVNQALDHVETYQGVSQADAYGSITKLLVEDKVQTGLAKEQMEAAGRIFRQRERAARRDTDALARQSLRGVNRLEVMGPLKKKADESQMRLQSAARDFALARQRFLRRQHMADVLEAKQKSLLEAMERNAAGSSGKWQGEAKEHTDLASGSYQEKSEDSSGSDSAADGDAISRLAALRTEFMDELAANGGIDDQNAHLADDLPVKTMQTPRLHIDGEVRFSGGHSTGDRKEYRYDNEEARLRVYPDYDIDGNWHAIGMIEGKKVFGDRHDKNDEKLRLDRYYLEGNVGLAKVDVGAFGSFMAEGNVYDSKFKGVRITAGNPVVYGFEYGAANDADRTWDATADYVQPAYSLGAGIYRFEDGYNKEGAAANGKQTVAMVKAHRMMGNLDVGAMALYGTDRGSSGTGYVFSVANGQEQSWKPHNRSWWLKYYYQPYETYYAHTMNGTADLMRKYGGFKGWGAGYTYTLSKDWMLDLEYYHLWDLDGHKASNTIWGSLTTYFKNYED